MVTKVRESDISELFGPETPIRKYIPVTIMKAAGVMKGPAGNLKQHEQHVYLYISYREQATEEKKTSQIMFSFCIICQRSKMHS